MLILGLAVIFLLCFAIGSIVSSAVEIVTHSSKIQ